MTDFNSVLVDAVTEVLEAHRPLWTDGECECGYALPVDGYAPIEVWQGLVWRHQAQMVVARLDAQGNFCGFVDRECGDHRTTGVRAWCFDDSEWCSERVPCRGCELPALRDRLTAAEAERDEAVELLRATADPMSVSAFNDWSNQRDAFLARLRDRST